MSPLLVHSQSACLCVLCSWLNHHRICPWSNNNINGFLRFDPNNPKDIAEAKRLSHMMVHRAQALGGTCTGEHGIGVGKIQYLEGKKGGRGTWVGGTVSLLTFVIPVLMSYRGVGEGYATSYGVHQEHPRPTKSHESRQGR